MTDKPLAFHTQTIMADCQKLETMLSLWIPLNPGELGPGDLLSGECLLSVTGDLRCRDKLLGDDGLLDGLLFKIKGFTAFIGPCLCGGDTFRRILCVEVGPCPDIFFNLIPETTKVNVNPTVSKLPLL